MIKLLSAFVMMLTFISPVLSQQPASKESPAAQASAAEDEQIPPNMTKYYMGIISRGPKWTSERTPETKKIFEGHMAHIHEMAQAKKLVLAGPFLDDGKEVGIFIFKVATLAEAKALADEDPAIKAGRFTIEIHPWIVEKGVLP